jgi:hypothetical protein
MICMLLCISSKSEIDDSCLLSPSSTKPALLIAVVTSSVKVLLPIDLLEIYNFGSSFAEYCIQIPDLLTHPRQVMPTNKGTLTAVNADWITYSHKRQGPVQLAYKTKE